MEFSKIYILLIVMFSGNVLSQEEVYVAFLQDSAAVGESVGLMISVDANKKDALREIQLKALGEIQFYSASTNSQSDSIEVEDADMLINDLGLWKDEDGDGVISGEELKWDVIVEGDQTTYRNRIMLSFFDVGIYVFEGFSFTLNGTPSKTNRALMKVTFKDYKLTVVDSTGLAPIKNIIREPLKLQDFLPYVLYILLPILLIYLAFKYYKKRQEASSEPVIEEVIVIPPDVKALGNLKELRQQELWQGGKIKLYQSELSRIIREYLEGRYDINALESTTSQIVRSIEDKSFTSEDQHKLQRILQISDLVKFAKAKPEVNIHEEFMDDAIEFVQRTRKAAELKSEEEE